jgi:hypothetical protein
MLHEESETEKRVTTAATISRGQVVAYVLLKLRNADAGISLRELLFMV